MDDISKPIVHSLKYRGWHSVATPMASRMARLSWPEEVEAEVEVVIAVPLSPVKARQRGYNQAEALARAVGVQKNWNWAGDVLERTRSAGSQTTLHPTERRANVAGAFRVSPEMGGRIAAKHVMLVDDVWTTGATALSCTDALLAAGARAVSVMTFARALPELEQNTRRVELARRSVAFNRDGR